LAHQFDIVENLNPTGRGHYPFLVILQHDRVSSIGSVVVAPLSETKSLSKGARLEPTVELEGRRYAIFAQELAAVPRQVLGRVVGSAARERYAIVAALDLLFTGI